MGKKLAHVLGGASIGALFPWLCAGLLMSTTSNDGPEGGSHVGYAMAAMMSTLPLMMAGATAGGYIAMRRYGRPPKHDLPPRQPPSDPGRGDL